MRTRVFSLAAALAALLSARTVRSGECVLFDAARSGSAATFEKGVWRLAGSWDLTQFGTVELTLAAGATGKNIASVRFVDAEGGVFSADVNFYGSEPQTRAWEIPPFFPEWRRTARAIDAVPFGKGKGLGRWGLDWRIWPTTRWHWCSGFYFDNVHLLKYTLDAPRTVSVEIRLAGETYGDGETSVRDWRMVRLVLKDAPRVSPNPPKYATMKSEDFFPFVDRYGQFKWEDWPEKIRSDADLAAARVREERDLAAHPGPPDWNKWGGWAKGPQLKATGRFRTERWGGKWWFVDPDGRLWWSHGAVRLTPSSAQTCIMDGREKWFEWLPERNAPEAQFYWTRDELMWPYHVIRNVTNTFDFSSCNIARKYGANWFEKWADICHRRLRSWGANTIANSSDRRLCRLGRTPYCDRFELKSRPLSGALGKVCWWPFRDPWDPSFRADIRRNLAEHKAELEDPWCFGFFVDNELQWGWTMRCAVDAFESGADQPAKRELVKDLRAKYGEIGKLNAAWGVAFADWRDVLARTKPLADYRHAQSDLEAFAVRMAEAYFSQIREEFKKAAPDVLYLGCRFSGADASAIRIMEKYADVMSFNIYTPDLSDFVVNAIGPELAKPVIVGEWAVSGSMERGNFTAHNVMRRSQVERGEQYRRYVESALHHPNVIGVHWHQFMDPATASGRYDGLTKQAGWVDMCDTPYWELVEAIREVGGRMYEIRARHGVE